ncbi:MAG: AraC family transcriptional regulator [Cytophagaceae bacterium BCCC1]|nr:MAG: AraC family transcriptional regulator [Cytophagaceae bacterium BCCC1]
MFYKKFQPPPHLAPYIECFYVWEADFSLTGIQEIESPPSGFGSIVFNYQKTYNVKTQNCDDFTAVPKTFITGQATASYHLQLSEKVGMVGLVFKPAALSTLFDLPMYEFTNERHDLRAVLGKDVELLEQRILNTDSHEERLQTLTQFLNIRLLKIKKGLDRTDYAANLIFESKGITNINSLMNELYVCRRQFERQFLNKVGISPKYYARTRRIGYLCMQLANKKWKIDDWHDLIYQMGYYDQSHFIKEFTTFTGKSPTSYLKNNQELGNYITKA